MILYYIYMPLLFLANILGYLCFFRNKINKNTTPFIYISVGLFFELIFKIFKEYKQFLITYYDIIFPAILGVSILFQIFKTPKFYALGYLILLLAFGSYFGINNFIPFNYCISILLNIIYAVQIILKQKINLNVIIAFFIGVNLYIMMTFQMLSQRKIIWKSATFAPTFQLVFASFLITTLIFINVKFWRSLNR